jgi:D-alanine transfer protein
MSGPTRTVDRASLPHLKAAVIAMGLVCLALGVGSRYARREISRHVEAIAPVESPQKNLGVALQREMFRHRDILPIYGSSEMLYRVPNRAADFFAAYPTGFAVSPVGGHATPPLVTLQQLAAVGPLLRGRKLALFLTPDLFVKPIGWRDRASYAGNFSRLQAGELVFSTHLSFAFKQRVARQLAGYPDVLEGDGFLRLTLGGLATGSPQGRFLYSLAWPLGRLQNLVLGWGDEIRSLSMLRSDERFHRPVPRLAETLDWTALANETEQRQPFVEGHLFGFRQKVWDLRQENYRKYQGSATDSGFASMVRSSPRWTDLELTLGLLRDLGADPMIISIPLHGPYMDYVGVGASTRQLYYQRLAALAARFQVPCLTFEEREYEPHFLSDPAHPSAKGWLAFDHALDEFYNDPAH